MAYTSEQYKYKLLKLLQRHFSMQFEECRYYTLNFYGKLLEGITLTEESYNQFVDCLYDNIQYCADNGIYECIHLEDHITEEKSLLLIDAFARIGIDLVINTGSGIATFTKPDGTVLVYKVAIAAGASGNWFYINAGAGTEYNYAKKSSYYYGMDDQEVIDFDEINYQQCGPDCYWEYDIDSKTVRLSGTGKYMGIYAGEQLGLGKCETLIVGSNVSEIGGGALSKPIPSTIVLLHSADFPLILNGMIPTGTMRNEYTLDVYTNNEAFRNYDKFHSKLIINWHTLDEWEG